MGLLDQILGGLAGGQSGQGQSSQGGLGGLGGLGDLLGGAQGRGGQGAGGLGGLLGDVLSGALSGQQGSPQQPQAPQTGGGGLGGGLNPILIAVLGMLASRAVGGMLQGGQSSAAAPQGQGQGDGTGGLDGLFEQFRRGGMGSALDSWVGTGNNQAVNPQQLEQMLGKDSIHDLACRMGVSDSEACKQMADVLPDVVDRLTPDGRAPAGGFGDIGSMLQQLLRQSR